MRDIKLPPSMQPGDELVLRCDDDGDGLHYVAEYSRVSPLGRKTIVTTDEDMDTALQNLCELLEENGWV